MTKKGEILIFIKIAGMIIAIWVVMLLANKLLEALKCLSVLEKLPQKIRKTQASVLQQLSEHEDSVMEFTNRLEAQLYIMEQKERALDREQEQLLEFVEDFLKGANNIFDSLSLINSSLEATDEVDKDEFIALLRDKLHENLHIVEKHRESLQQLEDEIRDEGRER